MNIKSSHIITYHNTTSHNITQHHTTSHIITHHHTTLWQCAGASHRVVSHTQMSHVTGMEKSYNHTTSHNITQLSGYAQLQAWVRSFFLNKSCHTFASVLLPPISVAMCSWFLSIYSGASLYVWVCLSVFECVWVCLSVFECVCG